MSSQPPSEDLIYFNGINATTEEYAVRPMSPERLAGIILDQVPQPADTAAARVHKLQREEPEKYGPAYDRDPKDLGAVGWGVIFAADEDPAMIKALEPLLEMRRQQAGPYYREYKGQDGKQRGYTRGESKQDFLERIGAEAFGPADPDYAPYYMLIAGDPERIPFPFQHELDVQYAVGRISFRSAEEYAQYARNVCLAEEARLKLPREATFFATNHDSPTYLSSNFLAKPLMEKLSEPGMKLNWKFTSFVDDEATKVSLCDVIASAAAPALLFTASHGVYFEADDARQSDRQGALLCQDFASRRLGQRLEDCYLTAEEIPQEANLLGSVVFNFACYSAGTPSINDYLIAKDTKRPRLLANQSFVARLPQTLLLRGALAVVGHVERAYVVSISFTQPEDAEDKKHLPAYGSTFQRLLSEYPVGAAMEWLHQRHGEYSTALTEALQKRFHRLPSAPSDAELIRLWFANNDARNYAVIGDPAVRICMAEADQAATAARPELRYA